MKAWSRAISKKADVAQSVVRRIGSAEVTGPIPVISSKKSRLNAVFRRLFLFLTHLGLGNLG